MGKIDHNDGPDDPTASGDDLQKAWYVSPITIIVSNFVDWFHPVRQLMICIEDWRVEMTAVYANLYCVFVDSS